MHTFEEQTKTVFSRLTKTIVLLRKLGDSLPKPSLPITLNKSFIRPHDINYDQSYINLFQKKIETAQYNTGFAITSAIRGKLKERPYKVHSALSMAYENLLFLQNCCKQTFRLPCKMSCL